MKSIKFKNFCNNYSIPFSNSGMAVYMGINCKDSKVIDSLKVIQSMLQPKIRLYLKNKYYRIFFNIFYSDFNYYLTLNQLIDEFILAYKKPLESNKHLRI